MKAITRLRILRHKKVLLSVAFDSSSDIVSASSVTDPEEQATSRIPLKRPIWQLGSQRFKEKLQKQDLFVGSTSFLNRYNTEYHAVLDEALDNY
mmetsp:Transcript_1171/g.1515  ORF Transcript_1171/g.1515 Transcript_1171/m.1515 type:complete len:94 (+) Transcript_1171:207-488(+)